MKQYLVLISIIIIILLFFPVEFAVDYDKYISEKEGEDITIIECSTIVTTGPDWIIEKINNEYKNELIGENIIIVGKIPARSKNKLSTIPYGIYSNVLFEGDFIEGVYSSVAGNFKIFKATNWKVAYPYQRDSAIFNINNRYLNIYEWWLLQ